jgi:hypothetical protein
MDSEANGQAKERKKDVHICFLQKEVSEFDDLNHFNGKLRKELWVITECSDQVVILLLLALTRIG